MYEELKLDDTERRKHNLNIGGKILELNTTDKNLFITKELDRVLMILDLSLKNNFNFYIYNQTMKIVRIITPFLLGKTLTIKDQDKINECFTKGINQFKFKDFCDMMGLERKLFKSVKYENDYCEIFLTDEENFEEPQMIYAGDYISRKKMFDEPIRTFAITVDGEDLVDFYLTIFWKKYYMKLIERKKEEMNNNDK